MTLRFNPDFGPSAVSSIDELKELQPGGVVYLIGSDGNASPYYWDGTSTATADDVVVVASNLFEIGRWLLFNLAPSYYISTISTARIASGASCTNGQPTVTCANAGWTVADIGKRVVLVQNDGTSFVGTSGVIASVSGNVATCSGNLGVTITSADVAIGFDVAADLNAVLAAAAEDGGNGEVELGHGVYIAIDESVVVPDGVTLRGPGAAAPIPGRMCQTGAVLLGAPFGEALLKVGVSNVLTTAGRARVTGMVIDGCYRADNTVELNGWGALCDHNTVLRGTAININLNAPGQYVTFNYVSGQSHLSGGTRLYAAGIGINVSGSDSFVGFNDIRGWGNSLSAIRVISISYVKIFGNHSYRSVDSNDACNDIYVVNSGTTAMRAIQILNNELDACYGNVISVALTGGAGCVIDSLEIGNNTTLMPNGYPNATFDWLRIDTGANGSLRRLMVHDNSGAIITAGANWNNFMNDAGATTKALSGSIHDNHLASCSRIFPTGYNFPNGQVWNNSVTVSGSTVPIPSNTRGKITADGGGTAFTFAHGMGETPLRVAVTAGSVDADGDFAVTADATNVTVTFGAATAGGTNNVVLWVECGL